MRIEILVKAAPRKWGDKVYFELYSLSTVLKKCNKFEQDIRFERAGSGGEFLGELYGSIADTLQHIREPFEMKLTITGESE